MMIDTPHYYYFSSHSTEIEDKHHLFDEDSTDPETVVRLWYVPYIAICTLSNSDFQLLFRVEVHGRSALMTASEL